MKYNTPEMELVHLEAEDIITNSPFGNGGDGNDGNTPEITPGDDWS